MELEIGLREYLRLLLRRWWFIAGLAVLAAAAALVISFIRPAQYEATAMVAFTMPQYVLNFDPRFQARTVVLPYRDFPSLATSDAVLAGLQEEMVKRRPADSAALGSVEQLRGMVRARSGPDTSLVILSARATSPQQAADLANAWAEVFVAQAQEVYGRSRQELTYYETQLADAARQLDRAEQALVEFQARNQVDTLTGRRDALLEAQRNYLEERKVVEDMVRDLDGLLAQLGKYPSSERGALGDELTALFLQVKAFNAGAGVPIQLEVTNPEALSERSVGELRVFLEGLSAGLQDRQTVISSSLAGIEPQVLGLQQQIQESRNELDRRTLNRDVARETYLTVARKVEETRLAVQAPSSEVHLVSRATVPETPSGPRMLRNAAMAGVLGLVLGVIAVLIFGWWRQHEPEKPAGKARLPGA